MISPKAVVERIKSEIRLRVFTIHSHSELVQPFLEGEFLLHTDALQSGRRDPHERGVSGSARTASQEEAAKHIEAQRSSDVVRPVDWTVVRGSDGRFARADPSSSGASECAGRSLVDNEPPRGSRCSQSVGTDWLVTSPQPGGPIDTRLIPSYGGHIAKLIFYGFKRMPLILECRSRKKSLEAIIRLRDMINALYDVLPATPLGRLPYVMHQHIDCTLISAFVERWQPDTNTFRMPWGR
ncbi:uncharacterized protein LOC130810853 [Amaranthus tricolor]|uniref:uncharacterized protein LOC130810853 n=1 Tax=Amaranthus tricolor TaxID=29722 RepID=UPI002587A01D|nr:uncharacterized protein LOC130810853 [Amaranthus tricolor]